jgi:hypothetical protein
MCDDEIIPHPIPKPCERKISYSKRGVGLVGPAASTTGCSKTGLLKSFVGLNTKF